MAPMCVMRPQAAAATLGRSDAARGWTRRRPWSAPPPHCAAHSTEQISLVAARLGTVRCRELLTATCAELLKAALVGSAAAPPLAPEASSDGLGPEALLESVHASVQAALQDAAHSIAPAHQEAWGEAQWDVYQEAHSAVGRLLLGMHSHAAEAGSAAAALQVARCLEHGLLVPPDAAAAHRSFVGAARLGSAEACLRCGIHCFEGTAPGGRDGAAAFDHLSRALELAEAGIAASGSGPPTPAGQELPQLAPPPADTTVEGDLPAPLSAADVRYSALTWLGRCYMEGAGVPRSVADAAASFRAAGNEAELRQLAALQRMFAELELHGAGTGV